MKSAKLLFFIFMILVSNSVATNAMDSEATDGPQGKLDTPRLTRMLSESDELLFALTGETLHDDEDRQELVEAAIKEWRILAGGFSDATLSPTLENIPALNQLDQVFDISSVSMGKLTATISLQQNKGGKLLRRKDKPGRKEILAAECLIGRGVTEYTDQDLRATEELQNDYRGRLGVRYENPELRMINAVKYLADIYGYETGLASLVEFLRVHSLMGENAPYPDEDFLDMAISVGWGISEDLKPDLEEIQEALEMKKQNNKNPRLREVQDSLKQKKPDKYLKKEQEAAARKAQEEYEKAKLEIKERLVRQCSSDPQYYVHEIYAGVQDRHAKAALDLQKYAGIKEPNPKEVMEALAINTQQEGSDVPGIPFEEMTREHIKGHNDWFLSDKVKQITEIQAKFWEK